MCQVHHRLAQYDIPVAKYVAATFVETITAYRPQRQLE